MDTARLKEPEKELIPKLKHTHQRRIYWRERAKLYKTLLIMMTVLWIITVFHLWRCL